jgi:hypothetical protein
VASAEAYENRAIASVLREPVAPFFEQGRPERQPPNLVAAIDHDASARSSFWNDAAIAPQQRHYRRLHETPGRTARREAAVGSAMKLLARHMIALRPADVAG